jgi:hypothetical protein
MDISSGDRVPADADETWSTDCIITLNDDEVVSTNTTVQSLAKQASLLPSSKLVPGSFSSSHWTAAFPRMLLLRHNLLLHSADHSAISSAISKRNWATAAADLSSVVPPIFLPPGSVTPFIICRQNQLIGAHLPSFVCVVRAVPVTFLRHSQRL